MEKVRGDLQTLYQMEEPHPPGIPLAKNVDPVQVNDTNPLEAEVEEAVICLRLRKAGGNNHLRAEYFKQWLQEAYPGENSNTPLAD